MTWYLIHIKTEGEVTFERAVNPETALGKSDYIFPDNEVDVYALAEDPDGKPLSWTAEELLT